MSEYKKIVFFNGHQHGDIANSRGVVNYIVEKLGDGFEYFFLHQKNQDAVQFNNKVKVFSQSRGTELPFPILGDIKPSHVFRLHYTIDDILYLNLWIGCSPFFKSTVRHEGIGITRKSLQQQTIECIDFIKENTDISIEYPSEFDVLPIRIETERNQELISEFVSKTIGNYRKRIFIPNGNVESGQTPQFNFGDEIRTLMLDNPDVAFIFTAKNFNKETDNVFFIDDYFPVPNLKDMDVISKWCDVLITRASGPGCVVSTKQNYFDTSKTFISFTLNPAMAFEALSSYEEVDQKKWGNENTAKMIWSNDFSPENLCEVIGSSIS